MLEKAEEKLSTVSTDPQLREIALERERREIAHRLTLTSAWDEGHEQGVAEGRAEGKARTLLKILAHHRVTLTEAEQERILSCRDLDQLEHWLDRALVASSAEELFEFAVQG